MMIVMVKKVDADKSDDKEISDFFLSNLRIMTMMMVMKVMIKHYSMFCFHFVTVMKGDGD